jgi:hypothetical protein
VTTVATPIGATAASAHSPGRRNDRGCERWQDVLKRYEHSFLPQNNPNPSLKQAVNKKIVGTNARGDSKEAKMVTNSVLSFQSGSRKFDTIVPSRFIRSTTGNCTFTVYNRPGASQNGYWEILGTNLSDRIRAGEGGVDGTGDTWKIRSLRITPVADPKCRLRIGGDGHRMDYFNGRYTRVPAMNRIESFAPGGIEACRLRIYGYKDYMHEAWGKLVETRGPITYQKPAWDPGFRVRSLEIYLEQ